MFSYEYYIYIMFLFFKGYNSMWKRELRDCKKKLVIKSDFSVINVIMFF